MAQLQERLADLADQLLASRRMTVDRDSARSMASRPLSVGEEFRVRALWQPERMPSQLPLSFEMEPVDGSKDAVRVVLSAVLWAEAWVTSRGVRKGSPLGCTDLVLEKRRASALPPGVLGLDCRIAGDSVALRDLGSRDVLRPGDVGRAPAVMANSTVALRVVQGVIAIETRAVALTDASEGEELRVRLDNPRRVVGARVTGPGRVALVEAP